MPLLTPEMKEVLIAGLDRALVFGRGEQFVVVFVEEARAGQAAYDAFRDSVGDLPLAGVMAMVNGVPACQCAASFDAIGVMILASVSYAVHIAAKTKAKQEPHGDSITWLESLFKLEDPRDCN